MGGPLPLAADARRLGESAAVVDVAQNFVQEIIVQQDGFSFLGHFGSQLLDFLVGVLLVVGGVGTRASFVEGAFHRRGSDEEFENCFRGLAFGGKFR